MHYNECLKRWHIAHSHDCIREKYVSFFMSYVSKQQSFNWINAISGSVVTFDYIKCHSRIIWKDTHQLRFVLICKKITIIYFTYFFCLHLQQEGILIRFSLTVEHVYVCIRIYARASRYCNKYIKNTARFHEKFISYNPLRP